MHIARKLATKILKLIEQEKAGIVIQNDNFRSVVTKAARAIVVMTTIKRVGLSYISYHARIANTSPCTGRPVTSIPSSPMYTFTSLLTPNSGR